MRYKHEAKSQHPWAAVPVFSVALVYLECVFRLATTKALFAPRFLVILLFSLAYGGLGYLFSTATRRKKANRVIAAVLLFLTGTAYVVEYLIHKQFKQFYDLNTMGGGAGDALTGFFKEILILLFPQGGILIVLLLLLPGGLYLWLTGKRAALLPTVATARTRLTAVGTTAAVYLLALLLVLTHPTDRLLYRGQYNFQTAVTRFGFITGLRLDAQNVLFGTGYSFDEPSIPVGTPGNSQPEDSDVPPEDDSDPEEDVPPVIEYGYNQVDIDFAALSGSAKQEKLDTYVSGLTPSKQNAYTGLFKGKNLILITAEAFSAEVIDEALTPTLYRLANKGIRFTDYYQPASAGTTGGEYQNLFGMIPTAGGKSVKNTVNHLNCYTIGSQLGRLGYYGKAFHNNTHTYYDRHKTHVNLGYSDGFMGYGNGMEKYVKSCWPQSDYEMFAGTLPTYIDKQPFSVYYMTVSGHSGYSKTGNSMTARHWDRVKDLPYSDTVKGYLAANLELEDSLAYVVSALEEKGIADDTVICLTSDHFPYGLDTDSALGALPFLSELYGYQVNTYLQRDHSSLILWCGSLEDSEPIVVDTPTFSLDILPTLSNLFGVEFDSRLLPGRDVFSDATPLIFNTNYDWKTELGTYYASSGKFVPVTEDTVVPEGYVDSIKAIVRNKITYCAGALETDYLRHLFG